MNSRNFISKWRLTVLAFVLLAPPVITTAILCTKAIPSTYGDLSGIDHAEVVSARKESIERATHFEQLMVALGSFELGILSYLGGLLMNRKSYISRPRLFFFLSIMLLVATTGAYLHVWRIYMSYGIYTVKLEYGAINEFLRVHSNAFFQATHPNLGTDSIFLGFPGNAAMSLSIISFYPVFVLCAAILAFGKRFEINPDVVGAMLVTIVMVSATYITPDFAEFLKLANLAAHP